MKRILTIIILTFTLILSACSSNHSMINKDQLPTETLHGSYSIDVNNINQVIGDSDYFFAAKINSEVETIYKNLVTIETESGPREIKDPYTIYSITVIDNIKGKLKTNSEFEITKKGGISEDQKSVVIYEDDNLLEVGKYYILAGYAQPDGSILVSGPNSSIMLPTTNEDKIISSTEYKNYMKEAKNEFKTDRKRYKSSFEE